MMKGSHKNILLVETGGFVPKDGGLLKERAMFTLDYYSNMKYDVINLGWNDFFYGTSILKNSMEDFDLPIVTTNLIDRKKNINFSNPYIIKEIGGVKIGFVGVMPVDSFSRLPNPKAFPHLSILDPEDAIGRVIEDVKKESDMVILLSQCRQEVTHELLDKFDIPFALSGRKPKKLVREKCDANGKPINPDDIPENIFFSDYKGHKLGNINFKVTGKTVSDVSASEIEMGEDIPENEEVLHRVHELIVSQQKAVQEILKKEEHKQMVEEYNKQKTISPLDFIQND